MQYEIFGGNLPAVTVKLNQGEAIYTQSGGMSWMTSGIQMETNMKGGLLKGLGRMLSGDSLFMATYSAVAPNQEITVASSFPGAIVPIDVSGGDIVVQKSAFLCAQPEVALSVLVVKGLGAGLFGGEGFILQRLSGNGLVFIEIDGAVCEKTLAPGETLIVDTGNVAAYEANVGYEVTMIKGFKNMLFGGEGLLNTRLTGPGKVWLQTMTLPGFAGRIIPFLPKSSN